MTVSVATASTTSAGMTGDHKKHFVFLDGLRGVAALAVAWLHISQIFSLEYRPTHAFLAVDFFFCLSGFVIAYAYDEKLSHKMRFSEFGIKRIIRLYPMIACGIAIGCLVSIFDRAGGHQGISAVFELTAASLLLFPLGLAFHDQAYPINNPIWSLFFESFANLVYAVERRFLPIRNNYLVLLSLLGSSLPLVLLARHRQGLASVGFDSTKLFLGGFVRVAFPFLAGVFIYRYSLFKLRVRLPSFLIAITLSATICLPIHQSWIYDCFSVIVIFPLVVIFGANATQSARMSRVWNVFGKISYPFYLVHQPILRACHLFQGLPGLPPSIGKAVPLGSLLLATGCAYGVLRFYDEPVRRWLALSFGQRGR